MKKVDNFNPGKWLVENKITTQSSLNEAEENSILLGYMLLWKGIPSKITPRSQFDEVDEVS